MNNAPIVTWTAAEGHRLATEAERASFAVGASGYVLRFADGRVVRRLSCSDPCDQRMIWFFAALALGATEDKATSAALVPIRYIGVLLGWVVGFVYNGQFVGMDNLPALWWDVATTERAATEALCAAVWGPK